MPVDEELELQGRRAATRAAEHAHDAATAAGQAATAAAEALSVVAQLAAERGRTALDNAGEVIGTVRESADRLPMPVVLEGVVEEAVERGSHAWDALRGQPRRSPRWPWAAGAAVAGSLLGVAGALAYKRLAWRDAPGAQDPEELQAVVDLPPAEPATVPTAVAPAATPTGAPAAAGAGAAATAAAPAAVDEDGEAVP